MARATWHRARPTALLASESRDAMSYTDSQLLDLLPASAAYSLFLSLFTSADANLSHPRETMDSSTLLYSGLGLLAATLGTVSLPRSSPCAL